MPSGKSHRHLAQKVCRAVPAAAPYLSDIEEGSVAPDEQRGFPSRHHSGGANTARFRHEYLLPARRAYLRRHCATAAFRLGVYLHFLADDKITVPGTSPRHQEYERLCGRHLARIEASSPDELVGYEGTLGRGSVLLTTDRPGDTESDEYRLMASLVREATLATAAVFAPRCHPDDEQKAMAQKSHRKELWSGTAALLYGDRPMSAAGWLCLPLLGLWQWASFALSRRSTGARHNWHLTPAVLLPADAVMIGIWICMCWSIAALYLCALAISVPYAVPVGYLLVVCYLPGAIAAALLCLRLCSVFGVGSEFRWFWTSTAFLLAPAFPFLLMLCAYAHRRWG